MIKNIEEILTPKPVSRPRIYAYSISDEQHKGQLKIGQTARSVQERVAEQLKTAAIENYTIELDEPADRPDGSVITDHEVRSELERRGVLPAKGEWMHCSVCDVKGALIDLQTGQRTNISRCQDFKMRQEQIDAVEMTHSYFTSCWSDNVSASPRFLWNAKMRFGKTFAAYKLAQKMDAMRILVVTFKPAVEDAWRSDIENHVDFEGWQYVSRSSQIPNSQVDGSKPFVYFGSFQDLLGRDSKKKIKSKNRWLHETDWDLVVLDEYHFGAWRDTAKELFEGEDYTVSKKEADIEYNSYLNKVNDDIGHYYENESEFLRLTAKAYLYLSGTPFRALATGEFVDDQIFNWTYTDEQRAKKTFRGEGAEFPNPYKSLPQLALLTYQMPKEIVNVACEGEFDEFDLNEFFSAKRTEIGAQFNHKDDVQKWLDIIRGMHLPQAMDSLKEGTSPPFPYSDSQLLPNMQHTFWLLPDVASCEAMSNLLREKHNVFWRSYKIIVAAGASAGVGVDALPPVRRAIGSGFDTSTITLSCGKLTTGVTVPQWSSILMLRNLKAPETYFQAAFRVQTPWAIMNPNGDDPNFEEVLKPVCYVFDFAPTRALRQISEYGIGLSPGEPNPEIAVNDLISFLPVLAYDGADMTQIDAGGILDIAMAGTSATLLARKWESAVLVNVDNDTLRRVLGNPRALKAVDKIEGWRSLGDNILETIVNKSEKIKGMKREQRDGRLPPRKVKELTAEEKDYKKKRKLIRDKLIKFATRIPAFMYLTDFRENTLHDVITEIEPELFVTVTGLTIEDFHVLVELNVFNTEKMNQAVFAFRRYEDASLRYTGIESHPNLVQYGLYDTVVAKE